MDDHPGFRLAVSQNKYLSPRENEMHGVLTVTASGVAMTPTRLAPEAAEVIVVDCSGSMSNPATKMTAAKNATTAAIDAVRDGVFFAVVAGTHVAEMVYPAERRLVAATPATKDAARRAVRRLLANGQTAMGAWLRLADELLHAHPTAVRHAMLLTDGKNLPRYRRDLDDALAACAGRFVCDGRGIGDDYDPEELLRVVSTLRGSADAIVEEADLVPEFAAMMTAAMGKTVPDVRLQIRPTSFARLRFVKQTYPTEIDLTDLGTVVGAGTTGFSTGSWSEGEEREFHVCVEVTCQDLHEDFQAASVGLAVVHPGSAEAVPGGRQQAIIVHWTPDDVLSSVLDPKVAHYTGHAELGAAVRAGRDALDAGDDERAAVEWGRAVALAVELGHERMVARMSRLVDVVGDVRNGVARLKPELRKSVIASALIGSSYTTPSPDSLADELAEQPAGSDRTCEKCGYISPSTAVVCEPCGHPLSETA